MASNNRKAPQRWPPKNPDDRNRNSASRVQQTGGSLHAKRRVDNKKVQETLDDMFVNIFDSEIIRSVAHSCGWKLNKSIETLITLAEGSEFPDTKSAANFEDISHISSHSASAFRSNERASTFTKSRYVKDINVEKTVSDCHRNVISSKNKSTHLPKSKSVMMNASQGTIKVTYKGRDDPDESDDDDADVVIEEENEFEIGELDFTFPDVSNQSMCQFLTPFVSYDQSCMNGLPSSVNMVPRKSNVLSTTSKSPVKCKKVPIVSQLADVTKTQPKKTKHWPQFERIKKQINEGIKVMVIMRGCSGSGKTSLARHIVKVTYGENEQKYIFSTDKYFVSLGKGKYIFDPRLLPTAHQWNQKTVNGEARKGINPIIIDNTNLEAWEMEPYFKIAVENGYHLELLEPRTSWRYNSFELERKNTHGIPRKKIEDMLGRFERDLTPPRLLSLFNFKYSPYNTPPQHTLQPRPALCKSNSSVSGAKKKSKMKKKDEKSNDSSTKPFVHVKNIKQINLSGGLGCDLADKEIKESLDQLLSEWNRSVFDKENATTSKLSEHSQESNEKLLAEVQEEFHFQNTSDCKSARKGVEVDLKSDSTENSDNEMEVGSLSDEWDDESEDDLLCSSTTLADKDHDDVIEESELIGKSNCMEYALVLKDGTLLPQKLYDEENFMKPKKENDRVWEYLLMTEDSKLMFNCPEHKANRESYTDEKNVRENELCYLVSQNGATNEERNVKEWKCAAPQNIEIEKSVECLIFPDVGLEGTGCNDALKDIDSKGKSGSSINTNDQSLDLLVAESAALLNIAFAGVDDSNSSDKLQLVTEGTISGNENTSEKLLGDERQMFHPIITTLQKKEMCYNLQNSGDLKTNLLESKSQGIYNNDHFDCCVRSEVHELECKVTEELINGNNEESECDCSLQKTEISKFTDHDFLTSIEFQKNEGKIQINDQEDIEDNSCRSNINKSKTNEKDILEKWAEGTSWDDQKVVVADAIQDNVDFFAPKPARNNKRPATAEWSPQRTSRESVDEIQKDVSENWCALDEAVTSWEVENASSDKNLKKPEEGVEPQPQRKMFTVVPQEDTFDEVKSITVEQLKNLSDNQQSIGDHNNACSVLSDIIASVENVLESDAKLENQDITLHVTSAGSEQKQSITLSEYSLSEIGNSFGASCSYSMSKEVESQRNVSHTSTNTHHSDFITLSNVNIGSEIEVPGVKILDTFGRNIIDNENAVSSQPDVRKLGQILMLDKSSMTYDIISSVPESGNVKEQLQELVNMFPHYSFEDLQEIFEKCNKDVNWTVDLLLESASQGIEISTPGRSQASEPPTDILVKISSSPVPNIETQNLACGSATEDSKSTDPLEDTSLIASSSTSHLTPTVQETSVKSPSPNKRNGKKDRSCASEVSLLLKKQLEENIVINDEHYSEHVSRIRKLRHGELVEIADIPSGTQEVDECLNEYTQCQNLMDVDPQEMLQQMNQSSIETNYVLRPDAPEWEASENDSKDPNDEEDETVSLKMDSDFAEQLHTLFGTVSLPFSPDVKPTLNLPLSVARQLHYYMMEAEQNTYDLMMQEDEELARKLQLQEDNVSAEAVVSTANQVPDLREIMDMEMALALYKADQKQNSPENKEDLAKKMTKNLLCEWFPSLPRDILVNVYEAHNHSFEDTLEVLLASTEEDNSVRTVMTPEARAAHEKALLLKASQECQKNKEYLRPYSVDSEEVTQEQALEDADFYRSEASRHYTLRNECQQKAQRAYQRGLTAAAAYYSQMASLHKERIEESNAKAASSLLLAHSLGNLSTTLDLHFLYVVEALQVLDMFLDHHLHQLLESSHRSFPVFVITGRGARSTGGRSRIKPAVLQRLEQRGLRHEEVNPGLLRVTIARNATSNTRVSS